MDDMNLRFRQLRKECKKTQEEWGEILGITRSGVAEIESGRRNVTEKHILMLNNWKECNVNREWLRTGEGNMFVEMSRKEEIATWAGLLTSPNSDNEFAERFVNMLSKLDKDDWKVLEKMAGLMLNENN